MEYKEPTIVGNQLLLDTIVKDELGIHARPSALIVGICLSHPQEIYLARKDSKELIDCKSVLNVLSAGIECNSAIRFYVEFQKNKNEKEAREICNKLKEITSYSLEEIAKRAKEK